MKILSVSYLDIWPYGEGKGIPSIFLVQKGLADRGHEVHFLCMAREGKAGESDYQGIHLHRFKLPFRITERLSSKPIRLDNILSHLRATLLFNTAWCLFQLISFCLTMKLCFKIRPRMIYCHDLTPAFPAWLASRLFRTKFVLRIYGTRDLYWKYRHLGMRLKESRDLLALRLPADRLILTKDGTHAFELALELGVRREKMRVWRNGVDFDMYDPDPRIREKVRQEFGLQEGQKIIISTSRLIPFYQTQRLIVQLPQLFAFNARCVCLIASDGPEAERFKESVAQNNIAHRVVFTGMVDRTRLKELLNASDLYINLTSYSNCNNSLFEAMMAGKAIVALDNEAIRELIVSGRDGYLIRDCELDYWPAAVSRILDDEELLNRFQINVRQAAHQKLWTWEERIQEEARLLEALS